MSIIKKIEAAQVAKLMRQKNPKLQSWGYIESSR